MYVSIQSNPFWWVKGVINEHFFEEQKLVKNVQKWKMNVKFVEDDKRDFVKIKKFVKRVQTSQKVILFQQDRANVTHKSIFVRKRGN